MKELTLELDFSTPAFLGNADQLAQWRTPPIKALIRQWWRVVRAKACNYDHKLILEEENTLFGKAPNKDATRKDATRSHLRLRLDSWAEGNKRTWNENGKFRPEGARRDIDAFTYLGYGPLTTRGADFEVSKKRSALEPGKQANTLWLGFPDVHEQAIFQALQLIHWFGTMGSRSRNGWGSLVLNLGKSSPLTKNVIEPYTRNWLDCLQQEWAHAIGKDAKGPLIWQTQKVATWQDAMKNLAKMKIALRAELKVPASTQYPQLLKYHVLAYPVTSHTLPAFKKEARLTNQLRFKVMKEGNTYRGIIVHLPCRAPDETVEKLNRNKSIFRNLELTVWPEVHAVLDRLLPDGRLR